MIPAQDPPFSGKNSLRAAIFRRASPQARWLGRFAIKCLEIPLKYIPFSERLSRRLLYNNIKRLSPTVITPEIKKDQTIKYLKQLSLPPESRAGIFRRLAFVLVYSDTQWAESSEECNHQACTPASLGTHTFYPPNNTDEFKDLVKTLLIKKRNDPDLPVELSGQEMITLFANALIPSSKELFKRAMQLQRVGMLSTDALSVSINEYIDALVLLIDRHLGIAIQFEEDLRPLILLAPMALLSLTLRLAEWGFEPPGQDTTIFHGPNLISTANTSFYARLNVYSSGSHAFIELIEVGEETGRAVGLYPSSFPNSLSYPALTKDHPNAVCSTGFQNKTSLYMILENYGALLGGAVKSYIVADLKLDRLFRGGSSDYLAGSALAGIKVKPKKAVPYPSASSWMAFNKKAILSDEYKMHQNAIVPSALASFPLGKQEYEKVSDFLDEQIEDCLQGDPSSDYVLIGRNCLNFVQDVFSQTSYPGLYTDYSTVWRPLESNYLRLTSENIAPTIQTKINDLMLVTLIIQMVKPVIKASFHWFRAYRNPPVRATINKPDDSVEQTLPSLPAESSTQGGHTQNRTQPVD